MKAKHKRMVLLGIGACMMLVALAIIHNVFKQHIVYFYTPSELAKLDVLPQKVRMGGLVAKDSVKTSENGTHVEFIITDNTGQIAVEYDGLLPNLFREGQGVIATGDLLSKDKLKATEILAKHDENYMPPEVANKLKEQGHWQYNTPDTAK